MILKAYELPDTATLEELARKLRRTVLLSTSEAGSGHPTSCLSMADIMAVLFFHEMRFDPRHPDARNADTFVLSKGHAAPILWAALKEAGAISEDPMTLRRFDSPLEGHPTPRVPWVRAATGSLGHGLSVSTGMALGRRLDGILARIYCLLGDGEMAEGSVWEAAELAAFNKLDNLCAIVDVNRLGQSGPTMLEHDLAAYLAKFNAFDWNAVAVDGHNIDEIKSAFEKAKAVKGHPTAIVARTRKGRGVSSVENKDGWHGKALKKGEELDKALRELGDPPVRAYVPTRSVGLPPRLPQEVPAEESRLEPAGRRDAPVATREAFGTALVNLGKVSPDVVALDGDVKNSTFAEKFKAEFPGRFFECYIAEQNMVGVALGLATEGKIPVASTFACFLTRAFDQIRMAGYSGPRHLVLAGSHAGVSIGEDGPSQMGLEDLALFRSVFGSTVLYPADAVSAERLTVLAARTEGIVYLRLTRPKTGILYGPEEEFTVGGSKTLRTSPRDQAAIVAAGVTVYEALKAHDLLAMEGIAIRVIDAYSVKPLDETTLRRAAAETKRLITVEDHAAAGGLGEAVASLGLAPVILAVRKTPRSGKPEELMRYCGISAQDIVDAVKAAAPGPEKRLPTGSVA